MKNINLILFALPFFLISCKNNSTENKDLKNQNNILIKNIQVLKDSLRELKTFHEYELFGVSVKPDFKNLTFGDTAVFSVNVNYGRPGLIQEIVVGKLNDGEDIFTSNEDQTRIDFKTKPQNFEIGSQKIKITNYQKGLNRLGGYLKLNNFRKNNEYAFLVEYQVK